MKRQHKPGLLAITMWIVTVVEFDHLLDTRVWHSWHRWMVLPTFLMALPLAIVSTLEWHRRDHSVRVEG